MQLLARRAPQEPAGSRRVAAAICAAGLYIASAWLVVQEVHWIFWAGAGMAGLWLTRISLKEKG